MKKIFIVVFMMLLVFSCGTKKSVASKSSRHKPKTERVSRQSSSEKTEVIIAPERTRTASEFSGTPTEIYIQMYAPIAQNEMRLYGIPASITLAQGILESGSGKGRLSVEANNHFGIKCHEWTGAKIYHDDDASQECFRKYNDPRYSFRDHSLFLTERQRYYKLFDLEITDYKGWAKELRAAGYATDRKYPDKLISLIERYNLNKYDEAVTGKSTVEVVVSDEITHKVVKGDTLYSLSKQYNTSVETLKELNGLSSNNLNIGDLLIVKSN
jgi:flagellum-specific peptidoglycan hydrolase FlgJ